MSSNFDSYRIYYKTNVNDTYTYYDSSSAANPIISSLSPNIGYYIRLIPYSNTSGLYGSPTDTLITTLPLISPQSFSIIDSSTITLNWTGSYKNAAVYYSTDNTTYTYFNTYATPTTTATVNGLSANQRYYFKFTPLNTVDVSGTTTYITDENAVTSAKINTATINSASINSSSITINWTGSYKNTAVYYSTDNSTYTYFNTYATPTTTATVNGLSENQRYYFKLTPLNSLDVNGTDKYITDENAVTSSNTPPGYPTNFILNSSMRYTTPGANDGLSVISNWGTVGTMNGNSTKVYIMTNNFNTNSYRICYNNSNSFTSFTYSNASQLTTSSIVSNYTNKFFSSIICDYTGQYVLGFTGNIYYSNNSGVTYSNSSSIGGNTYSFSFGVMGYNTNINPGYNKGYNSALVTTQSNIYLLSNIKGGSISNLGISLYSSTYNLSTSYIITGIAANADFTKVYITYTANLTNVNNMTGIYYTNDSGNSWNSYDYTNSDIVTYLGNYPLTGVSCSKYLGNIVVAYQSSVYRAFNNNNNRDSTNGYSFYLMSFDSGTTWKLYNSSKMNNGTNSVYLNGCDVCSDGNNINIIFTINGANAFYPSNLSINDLPTDISSSNFTRKYIDGSLAGRFVQYSLDGSSCVFISSYSTKTY